MLFGVVSRVGRGTGVLDGVVIVEGMWQFRGELGASHCNQWGRTATRFSQMTLGRTHVVDADLLSSLRWYHAPALVAFVVATRVQKDTFQQLQKLRRNRHGMIATFSDRF